MRITDGRVSGNGWFPKPLIRKLRRYNWDGTGGGYLYNYDSGFKNIVKR
jgi:hypothetical protein